MVQILMCKSNWAILGYFCVNFDTKFQSQNVGYSELFLKSIWKMAI